MTCEVPWYKRMTLQLLSKIGTPRQYWEAVNKMFTHTWASSDLTCFLYSVEIYIWTSCISSSLQSVEILSTELKELGVSIQFPYIGTYSVWVATEYVRYLQRFYDPQSCCHVIVLSVVAAEDQAEFFQKNVYLCVGIWMKLCYAFISLNEGISFSHTSTIAYCQCQGSGLSGSLIWLDAIISIFLLNWQWNLL